MGVSEIISLLKRTKRKLSSREIAEILHKNRAVVVYLLKKLRQKLFYPFISYDIWIRSGKINQGNIVYRYWYNGERSNSKSVKKQSK